MFKDNVFGRPATGEYSMERVIHEEVVVSLVFSTIYRAL